MVDRPSYTSQTVLNGFFFDSAPQSPSPDTHGALLGVDDCIVEVAREIDYNTVFGGRGSRRAMTAATNRNLEAVRPSVLQRERNVVGIFHEGHNASGALGVPGPPSYCLGIAYVVGGHDIPFERLLERGETRHPWRYTPHGMRP